MTRYDNRPLLAAIRAKIADLNAGEPGEKHPLPLHLRQDQAVRFQALHDQLARYSPAGDQLELFSIENA